ncbi:serine hydroxymethyltransferase [Lactobacillus intestinalis]|uniref:Serine hydroxymethyltransferase n=1 Tax=Lactobacillus intestinalis TaxID=151781 RepID=A0A4V3REI2_9LACO|nr:serine hydroxymethyltransferase [Lactobacillus intestinalis]TGY16580.1 serine hydroxymethyltransferase [Lactobacillus intestinalis]
MEYAGKDPELWKSIKKEEDRQQHTIELIASENIVSDAVREAQGSVLTNKYAEGYPGKRYYGGCQYIDEVEQRAIDYAKELFDAKFANVQPHSGSQANMAVYQALLKPGDKILGMGMDAGGHLTHGSKVNFSGKNYQSFSYGLNPETEELDYDQIMADAKEIQPQIIIAGASAYSRIIDWNKFREIADAVGAYLMVDMAHIAGLVVTGDHPNPVPVADVVTTTTHKTLRGPRGGMILTNDPEIAKKINSALFPGTQGGPLEHVIAAKAQAFYEDLQPQFKTWTDQVIKNAQAMAAEFNKSETIRVISGGTDNHLMILDITKTGLTGKAAQNLLDSVNITTNKESIPNDQRSPFITSGLRIGSPAITSRGFKEDDARTVADLIIKALTNADNELAIKEVAEDVRALTDKYPIH